MSAIIPIASKFNDSGIKKAQASFGSLGSSLKKLAGIAAAGVGIAVITKGLTESVKAAAEDAKSQKILADQLKRTTGATKSQIAASEEFVSKLSLQTGVLDDALRPALTNAVRGTGSLEKGQKLLAMALDGAAASGKPVDTVMNALIKAQNGNTASLYKLAPELKKTKGGLDEYAASVKGAAAASANPFDRFKVAMEELKETVGGALLPVINNLATALMPIINQVAPLLASAIGALQPIFNAVIAVLPQLMEAFKPIIDIVALLAGTVGNILGKTLIALMPIIIKVAEIIGSVLGMVLPIIEQMFDALLPVIMPFINALLLIVQALLPVIPPVLQLVMAFMPLVTSILPPLTSLLLALVPIITMVADIFIVMLMPVIDIVASLAKWLGEVLGDRINFIVTLVTGLMPIFKTVFTFIGNFVAGIFKGVIDGFKGFVNFLVDGINGIIGGLNTVLEGVKFASAGTIDLVIPKIPKLANGGIVMPSPGGSLVNVAEAGQAEAIIPLDKMGSMAGGGTFNITVNAGVGANGAQIGTEIVNAIKAFERSNGKGWRS
jgi:hypothetical protein